MYRPGVKSYTLDLCGGRRINPNNPLETDAKTIVKRELGIDNDSSFEQMKLLDKDGWNRDSSFSNVKIYVFLATLAPDTVAHSLYQDKQFAADYRGITNLLSRIECMQCRLALREWQSLLVQIAGFLTGLSLGVLVSGPGSPRLEEISFDDGGASPAHRAFRRQLGPARTYRRRTTAEHHRPAHLCGGAGKGFAKDWAGSGRPSAADIRGYSDQFRFGTCGMKLSYIIVTRNRRETLRGLCRSWSRTRACRATRGKSSSSTTHQMTARSKRSRDYRQATVIRLDENEGVPCAKLRDQALALANARIPHITYVEEIDVSALEDLRAALNKARRPDQPKLTVLPFLMRAMVKAIAEQPQVNALYDDEAGVLHRHGGVHSASPRRPRPVSSRRSYAMPRRATSGTARRTRAARPGGPGRVGDPGRTFGLDHHHHLARRARRRRHHAAHRAERGDGDGRTRKFVAAWNSGAGGLSEALRVRLRSPTDRAPRQGRTTGTARPAGVCVATPTCEWRGGR